VALYRKLIHLKTVNKTKNTQKLVPNFQLRSIKFNLCDLKRNLKPEVKDKSDKSQVKSGKFYF
jgi:hypothetical protein